LRVFKCFISHAAILYGTFGEGSSRGAIASEKL